MERIVRVFKFFIWVVFLNVGNYQYAHSSETDVTETHKLISGNSLKIINKYGTSIIFFEAGGTFKHAGKGGASSTGTWRVTKDSMCATTLPQPTSPLKEFCLLLKDRDFGQSWSERDPRNGEITITLLKGHAKLE